MKEDETLGVWLIKLELMSARMIVDALYGNENDLKRNLNSAVYIALYIKIDLKALNKLKHATLKIQAIIIAQQ